MKIVIKTQEEWNALPKAFEEYTELFIEGIVEINKVPDSASVTASGSASVTAFGSASVTASGSASVRAYDSVSVRAYESASVTASDSASVTASGSASVTAFGSASVTASDSASVTASGSASVTAFGSASMRASDSASVRAYDSTSVTAFGSASVTASGSASVRAYDSASVTAFGSASVRAFGSASVRAYDSASVTASDSASVRVLNSYVKLILMGAAIAILHTEIEVINKSNRTTIVKIKKPVEITNNIWLENHGILAVNNLITLFKRVSKDLKTQEDTENETLWSINTVLEHENWQPTKDECGEGKFHGCAETLFCDEFGGEITDRYIAIEINIEDLFAWKTQPQYPHKIAFRKGKVIYECDKHGRKIEQVK